MAATDGWLLVRSCKEGDSSPEFLQSFPTLQTMYACSLVEGGGEYLRAVSIEAHRGDPLRMGLREAAHTRPGRQLIHMHLAVTSAYCKQLTILTGRRA